MLDDRDRRLIAEWNDTDREYDAACAHQLFERQAERTPDAVALVDDDRCPTYREVNERANRLAHHLRRLGIGAEVLVGLCFDRCIDSVVSLLGILKAGGAYVPLDPAHPFQRLEELAIDSRIGCIVTSANHRKTIGALALTVCLDDLARDVPDDLGNPRVNVTPDNLAYLLYTSGTTGKPKGVLGVHRSITNRLHAPPFAHITTERSALNSSLSYGFSIARIFLPLLNGVPLVIVSEDDVKDVTRLARRLHSAQVTNAAFVTPLLRQVLGAGHQIATLLHGLRSMTVGGTDVTPDLVASFASAFPRTTLINCYAATEVGGAISLAPLSEAARADRVPVGRPIANTRVHILDADMNPVPIGDAGELHVGAAHLARGYLNEAAQTASRFVPDPFSGRSGARLYRTGDLARYRPNGDIELLGRVDDQVKIRGFRVILGDVAAVLKRHGAVRDAVVVTSARGSDTQLIAYVVLDSDAPVTAGALRRHMAECVPDFMVPAEFALLDRLPLNANGKIDVTALPPPPPTRPSLDVAYEQPRNSVEAVVSEIWARSLGMDRVGIHDHFLELGGDSFVAARVALRLQDQFGLEIPVRLILERPTVAQLADEIIGDRTTG